MGKGRRLTISRSERFLGNHHESGDHHHVDGEATVELELMEEDIWSVVVEPDDDNPPEESAWNARTYESSGGSGERRINGSRVSGLTVTDDERGRRKHVAKSAPVNVPDWSKILRVESVVSMHVDVADNDWENEMVPPHEYVARSRNGNGNGGSSVFLGVGRTLKGRDMRRVRDAVWRRTGFYG